ncbi:MAG: cyclase family protein [Acidobacteria bacterium]|nr:cyclase family protein [Acidobacteriota bacterium]
MKKIILLGFLLSSCARGTIPTLEDIASGDAAVVDLGHALNRHNPYWPGPVYEPFQFKIIATLEKDGVYSGAFSMPEHLGTHLDAPNHFKLGQKAVDQLELSELVAPMAVIDVRSVVQGHSDYQLSLADVEAFEKKHGPIAEGTVVFALTGWGRYWNDFARYKNQDTLGRMHFPGFSSQAVSFLLEQRRIKGLGIDTLSVDFGPSRDFEIHHLVHGKGGYHIENAANLERVPSKGAWLLSAPIKIEKGSGGPARVWSAWRR